MVMSLPEPGETILHFEVLEKIGSGGMGAVYRARDTRLERDVALKFLTGSESVSPESHRRFQREARALASLRHPNIVTIHDFDELDGTPFLVLEWLPGSGLDRWTSDGPCSPEEFVSLARPVAEALAAAHRQGIVHRDVKPSNVLLTSDGEVKLADFGLAKLVVADQDLTDTGTTVGTVAYMSPEQVRGAEVGPASDVFSFGVMAYELLVGEHPFRGESPALTLFRIVNQEPEPIARERPELPADLVALIERCLDKSVDRRPADGTELVEALRRVAAGGETWRDDASSAPTRVSPGVETGVAGQEIRFCHTEDGVGIAYSILGSGPPLVRVLGWFTHLEMEWEWPELRYLWERLGERFTVIRYDGRGIGLSDRWEEEFTEETRCLDLEAVLAATEIDSANLLAISEGGWTAAAWAVEHPDRVDHLIFYGCYSRGMSARAGYDAEEDEALMVLMQKGWGRKDPSFRQVFTSQFFPPDADPRLIAHFNELQRLSADGDTAVRYVRSVHTARGDGREIFERLRVPSLVLHRRNERSVSFDEGRRLAALIPGAQFKPLGGSDHYFPTDRQSADEVFDAVVRFVEGGGSGG